eukprot:3938576-Pleurochrysis_carterae.AAC.1
MRADSCRSQEFASFKALGACQAGRPDATPTLRRGASVPHHTSPAQYVRPPLRPCPPRAEDA